MKTISRYIMTLALLLTAATGAWATDVITVTWSSGDTYENNNSKDGVTLSGDIVGYNGVEWQLAYWESKGTFTTELGNFTKIEITGGYIDGFSGEGWSGRTWTGNAAAVPFWGYITDDSGYSPWTITFTIEPASDATDPDAIDVTTDAAEEGATFTEASFLMPTSDVTVDYELVRDMSVQMSATMGDGTDGLRYRVKKSEQNPGKYEPADMNMLQVLTLVAVHDGIEQKDLTLEEDYFCRIYKLDEQTKQPEGDGVLLFDFDFAPGLYALKAFATDGSNYDGETALSNTFKLFEGYELKIAAGEYATYYKDEALYVEDEDAQLYTITSVNGDKANVVQVDVAKANMPILVKNNSADEKTILLIPTSEQTPDEVSAAEEFVGTLTATQIAASDATTERYAFNGKEFVWVKDAIAVGANRAWLEVPTSFAAGAHAIELVFDGETTRILSVENGELRIENYDYIYNLSGQRVSKDYKGVVVVNGKKVIRK